MKRGNQVRYLFVILLIVVLYLSFLVIKPFITPLLIAIILAFILHPVYKWSRKYIKNKTLAALLISILLIALISIPTFLMVDQAVDEAQVFYQVFRQKFISGEIIPVECAPDSTNTGCKVAALTKTLISDAQFQFYINEALKNTTKFVINYAQDFFLSIPKLALSLFIVVFATFYLIRDGDDLVKKIKKLIPLTKKHQTEVAKQFKQVTSAVLYGYILTAILQGILGGFVFWIVGIPSPILWGVIMTVFALFPFGGTALIIVPALLLRFAAGDMQATIILIIAAFVIGNIDNFVRPKLIGDKSDIHPVIVLVGVLGGIFLFGVMGFLIGPLIFALLLTFLNIYETEKIELGG
jgi:predicted PurR-regulated permease PerM|tara:strand:- start:1738 stop:2793 length:1056 start_codon:yes stop_codon:yes gene_type:complete